MAKRHALGIDFGGTKLLAAEVRFLAVETTSPLSRSTTAASIFVPPKSIPSACRFAISAPFLAWARSSLSRVHAGFRPPSRNPRLRIGATERKHLFSRERSPPVQLLEQWGKLFDGLNRDGIEHELY